MTLRERLESKITLIPFHSCWEWTGAKDPRGYGQTRVGRKIRRAHRVYFEPLIGPVPPGLELDHLCRNRSCVRPDHLEPVTHQVNIARYIEAGHYNSLKTHCYRGHALSGDNLYEFKPGGQRRSRVCRACRRINYAEGEYYAKK